MEKLTLQISILTIIFSFPVFAQDLNIASGGSMYVSPAAFVYASSNVDINSNGDLIMDSVSNDYSDFFVVGTSTGNAEYRHFTASSATRDLVSPPVSGQTFASFATANSGKIAAGTITSGNLMYGPLDNATGTYVEYASTDTAILSAGKGYRAGLVGGQTLAYSGAVTTVDVPVTITYGSAAYKESNLVGNPYTTHLIAGPIVTALGNSSAIDATYAAIYGWNGIATSDASTWKLINSLTSTELITPGQGFLLISSAAGGTFTFPESARRVSTSAVDDFITTGRQPNTHSYFKLKLTKGSNIHETSLYFIDANGSRGLDVTYDAGSLGSDIGTHLVENSQGVNLAIQALSTADLTATDYVIPVEVSVAAGQEATISVDDLNVPSGTEFYLDDTELNIQTLITSNDYTFTPSSALSGIGRFYLRTTSGTFSNEGPSSLDSIEILSVTSTKQLLVRGQLFYDSVLKLYDIRGRIIETYPLEASQTQHEIDVSNISSGVYIVNLSNKSQSKTTKLVIN
ncbi:T9SS type A sorting domain-containing protein [bacterium]|nr:T9SS type A sorting domain-containing protein [bacterium]